MTSAQKPEGYRTNIRLSKEMSEWVKSTGAKNFRSFNGEIVELIRNAMKAEQQQALESSKPGHATDSFHGAGSVTSLWSTKHGRY